MFKILELFHIHVFGTEVQGFERDYRLVKVLGATLAVIATHKLHRGTKCDVKGLCRAPMSWVEGMEISHSGMQKVKLSALSDLHSHQGALSVVGEFGEYPLQYNNPVKNSCFSVLLFFSEE